MSVTVSRLAGAAPSHLALIEVRHQNPETVLSNLDSNGLDHIVNAPAQIPNHTFVWLTCSTRCGTSGTCGCMRVVAFACLQHA